jgi:hypothetical protein
MLIHLVGTPEEAGAVRAGDPVEVRRNAAGPGLVAFAGDGQRLGRLLPDAEAAIGALPLPGARGLVGRIAALVPRPPGGGLRVHILLAAPTPAAG